MRSHLMVIDSAPSPRPLSQSGGEGKGEGAHEEIRRKAPFVAAGLWVLLLFLFPGGSASAEDMAEVRVYFPNGEFVRAEAALSMGQREKGLMFRNGIAADRGMLFVFEDEVIHSFWMKNVSFPIDILWLDREKSVVHIAKRVPPCRRDPCPTYTPVRPSAYVLELRAGRADELGIKPGDRLEFAIRR